MKNLFLKTMPLRSWDIFMQGFNESIDSIKKKKEQEFVISIAKKFGWQNNLELIFQKNEYEALIITDINQKIIWVNDDFSTMTGYSKKTAINNTPRFLQGEQTSVATKQRIREKIKRNKPFEDVIINHRKDNSSYKCEIKVFPLFNKETTHFIALEKLVV